MTIQISDAIREFLLLRICTAERLDVLLFLFRQGSRWWTAEAVAAEIGMPPNAVQEHLEALSVIGLLDVRVTDAVKYSYQPTGPELAQLVDQVAHLHYAHRDALFALLTRQQRSLQLFADAFRLRRGKDE